MKEEWVFFLFFFFFFCNATACSRNSGLAIEIKILRIVVSDDAIVYFLNDCQIWQVLRWVQEILGRRVLGIPTHLVSGRG